MDRGWSLEGRRMSMSSYWKATRSQSISTDIYIVHISTDMATEYQQTRGRDSADMSVDTSANIRLTCRRCLC